MYFKEIDVSRETMHSFEPKRGYDAPFMPKNSKNTQKTRINVVKWLQKEQKSHLIALKRCFIRKYHTQSQLLKVC